MKIEADYQESKETSSSQASQSGFLLSINQEVVARQVIQLRYQ